uniref:glutathione transferase n=1 Tax=Culicoides sonorensis TaxID=179676 RepID=A0A336MW64_CULSO
MVNKNMIPTLWYMLEGPPSRAVLLTIRNLRLDVKLKLCRTYLKEHLDPKFVSKNPLHTVPFLDDNGFHLTDSHAITQYLVETKAPASTLIGHTPQEKALLNDRLYFDNLLFHKTRAIIAPVLRGYAQDIPEDKAKDLHETLEVLDMYVENGKWVANDHYTIADFHALPIVTNIQSIGMKMDRYHNIMEWLDRCRTIPGYDENSEGAKAMGELFKKKIEENKKIANKA